MINPAVLAHADEYRESFVNAAPFRHVVMEDFLSAEAMAELHEQFPAFQDKYALNEFGEVGGKAVITDLKQVSPAYERLYAYLNSQDFLDAMSAITGIPDLLPDPQLYGGGTHENVEGQELDPHVDYNYINGGKLHRRLNLLLYFNKEWEEDWGGAIELHSNPRRPEEDLIKGFLPLYNRALIFETNERSWHGFRQIRLPEGKKHLTRRSLAIYLYTATRPEEEIAPPHGTFYVQRHLPGHIKPGHVLTEESLREIKILMRRRDDWIEFYQRKELEDSRTIQRLSQHIATLRESGPAPMLPSLARRLYLATPVSMDTKLKCKDFLFTRLGFLFSRSQAYRDWREFKSRRD